MTEPLPPFARLDFPDFITRQHKFLEEMFCDKNLAELRSRHPEHPAVDQYEQLIELAEDGLVWPSDFRLLNATAEVLLDLVVWIPKESYDDIWQELNQEAKDWTIPMLSSPDQYQDVMAELYVWGWLREQEVPAERTNASSLPDVLVRGEWPIEVKRIHLGTGLPRVRTVLKKANRQIKKSRPGGGGSVYLSVERERVRDTLTSKKGERIPAEIEEVITAVQAALGGGQLRSVTQVIVGWDHVRVIGQPPGMVTYLFCRGSAVVSHPTPREEPMLSAEQVEFGRTVAADVTYRTPGIPLAPDSKTPIDPQKLSVGRLFRDQNGFPEGIRAKHALDAMKAPDDVARIRHDQTELVLATRRRKGKEPFVLLMIARGIGGDGLSLIGGYRIYRTEEGVDLGADALEAFRVLLERYGLRVAVGEQQGLFIAEGIAPPGESAVYDNGSGVYVVTANTRPRHDGSTEYASVFAIDGLKYRTALSQKQS